MAEYDLLVTGGVVVDPLDKTEKTMNLALKDGVIAWTGEGIPGTAERILEVEGTMICPGFIDTHMHDEEIDDPDTTQMALLRQGVTTCIAGNCGTGPLQEKIRPSRSEPWLNIGYMTGHTALREEVGITEMDRYRPATDEETARMKGLLVSELEKGSFGLSLGLEYNPETSWEEIVALAQVVPGFDKRWISSHIRYDGPRCIEAVEEMIKLASTVNGRVQISHLGSMTSFGFAADALKLLHNARTQGLDLTWDSYPYAAFSTYLGSAVFDPGFEKRFNKPISALEVGSGPYAGKRLDRELFEQLRKEQPRTIIVAHVMNEDEMKLILKDPLCAIASDAVLFEGRGHPRVAGAFPRGINWLREEGLTWSEAICHATAIPAEMCWLNRGQIKTDSTADLVIFDPQTFADRATFAEPLLPPEGIRYVIVNGKVAVDDGDLNADPCGKFLTRS
jgi:N-acyl-D-amino-acid deacylase